MRHKARRAFTLVEILIVVVILGILAAIVIPQFTSASEEARLGNVQSQLQTIRSQIELFRVRNNGEYPASFDAAADQWDDLVGDDYLRAVPVNPFTRSSSIDEMDDQDWSNGWVAGNADNGWVWDPTNNVIAAMVPGRLIGVDDQEWVAYDGYDRE